MFTRPSGALRYSLVRTHGYHRSPSLWQLGMIWHSVHAGKPMKIHTEQFGGEEGVGRVSYKCAASIRQVSLGCACAGGLSESHNQRRSSGERRTYEQDSCVDGRTPIRSLDCVFEAPPIGPLKSNYLSLPVCSSDLPVNVSSVSAHVGSDDDVSLRNKIRSNLVINSRCYAPIWFRADYV